MNAEPLDSPATPARLSRLVSAGLLSRPGLARALGLGHGTPPEGAWRAFLARGSLSLGSLLVVSGVIFFFAYNWATLPAFGKFGMLEAGVAAGALVAFRRGLGTLVGQIALLAAAILVGPLLGVYGQTYQTGADPYELFLGWAALISLWVLVSRFAPLWLLWLLLIDLSVGLYWKQVLHPFRFDHDDPGWLEPVLFCIQAAAWAGWEAMARRGARWARGRWVPRLLGAATLAIATAAAVPFVIEDGARHRPVGGAVSLFLLLLSLAASLGYYRGKRLDLFPLAAGAGAAMVVLTSFLGRLILDDSRAGAPSFLVLGALVLVQVAAAAAWLRHLGRGREEDLSMARAPTMREVGEQLRREGLVEERALGGWGAVLGAPHGSPAEPHVPWFVRVLVGLGAWVATLLFVVGVAILDVIKSGVAAACVGMVLTLAAIAIARSSRHDFAVQLSLAMSMTGRVLTYGGIGVDTSLTIACAAALPLEALTIYLHPDPVNRFVSTAGVWLALNTLLYELRVSMPLRELSQVGLAAAAAALWHAEPALLSGEARPFVAPVGYGLVVCLLLALLFGAVAARGDELSLGPLSSAGLAAVLVGLVLAIDREHRREHGDGLGYAKLLALSLFVAALGLVTMRAPGVLGALLVLLLGFHRKHTLLLGIAVVFLLLFGSHFYYALEATLLAKSGVLIGSGLLLLGLRFAVLRGAQRGELA